MYAFSQYFNFTKILIRYILNQMSIYFQIYQKIIIVNKIIGFSWNFKSTWEIF